MSSDPASPTSENGFCSSPPPPPPLRPSANGSARNGPVPRHSSISSIEFYDVAFKVMLVGDSGVGKTCLLIRFKDGAFLSGTYISTVGMDFRNKVVTVDDSKVKLQIWDTAGQERFRSVTHAYYRDAHALLLLYDVSNKTSFDNTRAWLGEINEYAQDDVVIMLIGNKADIQQDRQVRYEDGERLSREYGVAFMETSAKTGSNVELAFMAVARELKQRMSKNVPDSSRFNMKEYIRQESQAKAASCCSTAPSSPQQPRFTLSPSVHWRSILTDTSLRRQGVLFVKRREEKELRVHPRIATPLPSPSHNVCRGKAASCVREVALFLAAAQTIGTMKPSEPTSVPEEDTAGNQVKPEIADGGAQASAVNLPTESELPNGHADTEGSDSELEEAFNAVGTVVNSGIGEAPAEDWESEINPPCFVIPPRSYLYGKSVFVPSDIHAVSARRKTPWLQSEEGQFDDAEEGS